jgi:phosphatidate cytidylyltransferase
MKNLIKRILTSILILPIIIYLILLGGKYFFFLTTIVFIISVYEWHKITTKFIHKVVGFVVLIFSFWSFYILTIDSKVFFVLLICISTDVGGYIFGKLFKGPKLTKISPNKTYAGVFGSFFISLISVVICQNFFNFNFSITLFLTVIAISTISQIGDLTISYFKRLSKVKNTSNILPGHGGVLDRIDGMIFAFPFYNIMENIILAII